MLIIRDVHGLPITVWERSSKKYGHYEFNHIQDGWEEYDVPRPYCEEQEAAWKNYFWRKTFAFLKDGHINYNAAQNLIAFNL